MADIVLCTLNAKYVHASFGLRCLYANMAELAPETTLCELDINQRPLDMVETLVGAFAGRSEPAPELRQQPGQTGASPPVIHNHGRSERGPRIVGFGVYIWNVRETASVIALLRRLMPEVVIVLGGPEVSHDTDTQAITALADYVVCGEADLAFAALCRALSAGRAPETKIIRPPLPDLAALASPYDLYSDADCAHRVVYVEASRGCPYSCEFCLSSLDEKVRAFPLDAFLAAMQRLCDRGVRQFKFVDRTFNLNVETGRRILSFFLERPGLFAHFELVPDRLPDALREVIRRFPKGALQFEVGVQTLTPEVERNVSRRQHHGRLAENFRFLREETGVHVHADLIAGLPGETLTSFAHGFDTLYALRPHEIQVGMLKRLRGTPIMRHDRAHAMVYAPEPPYEILQTATLDFATVQRLRRFAKYWEMFHNSGRFALAMTALLEEDAPGGSPFVRFLAFADWLHGALARVSGIALNRQMALLARYLHEERGVAMERVRGLMVADYQRTGKGDRLDWLFADTPAQAPVASPANTASPKRQARHLLQEQPMGSVIWHGGAHDSTSV